MSKICEGVCGIWGLQELDGPYHEAEISPLVEEVAVYVDAVGFGEVFGDHLADGGEVDGFLGG